MDQAQHDLCEEVTMTWLDTRKRKFDVLERTEKENDEYSKNGYGHEVVYLDSADIETLMQGRGLAWSDGEYTTALYLIDES